MHASMNHAMPRRRPRAASRHMPAVVGLTMLAVLLLASGQASAQQQSYQITWQQCFDRDSSADTDVYGTVGFTVPTTGEQFVTYLRVIHNAQGSSLSFDHYAADGSLVATIDVSGTESTVRTTAVGQQVSQDAAIAFVEILADPDFQTPLRACMAVCTPSNQALFDPLCLLSKTLCCGLVTDVCSPCDLGGITCHDTFHDPCP